MAPLPVIPDTYRCAFVWTGYGVVNVTHFHAASSTPSQLGDLINSHVSAGMWGAVTNQLKVAHVDITPLGTMGSTFTYNTDQSAKWTGSGVGDTIPGQCAVLSMKTVERGPANRGRMYLGPVAEQAQVNGTLDTTQRNSWVNAWVLFGSQMIAGGAQHVVASYKNATALTVVNYAVRPAMGTMRRRQDRIAYP